MLLTLRCPRCRKILLVPSKMVGETLSCPKCDVSFTAKVVATATVQGRRRAAKRPPPRAPRSAPAGVGWQPAFPLVTSRAKPAFRSAGRRDDSRVTPRRRSNRWLRGIIAASALLAIVFFLSQWRHEWALSSVASLTGSTNHVSSIERTTTSTIKPDGDEKQVSPAMVAEKTFADWSVYHSAEGGFSVYMPDRREEKPHLRSESLGLDGQGVQAQFVQVPDTSDPIESWPAIGAIWLRAMCIDNSVDAPLPEGATSTTVNVADLPGTEFVSRKGNEIQKTRLFVIANRTIILSATFVGRESEDDSSLPFGEQVDRFLGSLRLSAQPVDRLAASTASGTNVDDAKMDDAKMDDAKMDDAKMDDAKMDDAKVGEAKVGDGASDSFAVVEGYLCELTGSDLSEDLIRTRVNDLKAAALKAQASPEEVLTLLRSAKEEAEARGMSSELAIRAVTGTLGAQTQRKR